MDIKRERRREWAAALRSGEYKQTSHTLRDGNGFCCLGVACDKSGLGEWTDQIAAHATPNGSPMTYYMPDGEKATGSLPQAVADYYGIGYVTGVFYVNGKSTSLVDCNDNGKTLTFDQIADLVEAEPSGLVAS